MQLPTITGERITLRKLRRADLDSLVTHAADPEVGHYLPEFPESYTEADGRQWIRHTWRGAARDSEYSFGIADNATDEIIGMITCKHVNRADCNTEIGYWLARRFWRNGLTTEAIALVLEFIFEHTTLLRAYAIAHEANVGSWRALEKNGFVREGTWRRASFLDKKWADVYAYGILKDEYLARKK